MMAIRLATPEDADELFEWRNDPGTMAASRSTLAVNRADHDRWMQYNVMLGHPNHLVLIAEIESESLGVIRFDMQRNDVMTYETSITMAPKFRGMGLALPALATACNLLKEYTLNAEIRKDNKASRKIFEGCGFEKVGKRDEFVKYQRGPVS